MDFFDKMKDGITRGIDTIGAKGKELVEDTQLQLQLSSLRDQRRKSLEELGALAYTLFQRGALTDEGAQGVCASIVSLDRQIADRQAELKHDQPANKSEDAATGPAATEASVASVASVACECGAENIAAAKFCSSCGKKLG